MASTIRGSDNFDSAVKSGLGEGQTWQDVTSSRALGTTYTNSTGRTIAVIFNYYNVHQLSVFINENFLFTNGDASGYNCSSMFLVSNGDTYRVSIASGNPLTVTWKELR